MATEEEQTEELSLLDIGHLAREEKRRRENEAAAHAERREATSVFFERSWRRHATESLGDVHRAVDDLGRPRAREEPPAEEADVPGLSAAEARAVARFLGTTPAKVAVVQRSERGALVDADGRLLSLRGTEVREFADAAEPPAAPPPEPAPATTAPEPVPAPLPPPETPATAPAPVTPPEPAPERKGLRGKLPFGRKGKDKPEEKAPATEAGAAPATEPKPSKLSGLKGKLPFGKKKE